MEKIVLRDQEGQVVRAYDWSGKKVHVVRRADTRRLEIVDEVRVLEDAKVAFQNLGELDRDSILKKPFLLGELGHLELIENIDQVAIDEKARSENKKIWILTLGLVSFFTFTFVGFLRTLPQMTPKIEEELKQQVVKIVKNVTPPPKKEVQVQNRRAETVTPTKTKQASTLKRMGALSALGSLSSGKQKGGLDLSAAQTSAGPGLGGTQGSGGVQTSLYAKGLVAAPLGAGHNVQGAGGYGTKGKGGGQAGYGKLALTGSTGASAIPLGTEASVASGLDRDQIAAVINRNQGQVRFCYEQGLQSDPALNGRVAVDFTIGGNGIVKAASVASSTLGAKAVEECILMRLKTWKFPLPDGGVDVKVSYPFTLRRSGQG